MTDTTNEEETPKYIVEIPKENVFINGNNSRGYFIYNSEPHTFAEGDDIELCVVLAEYITDNGNTVIYSNDNSDIDEGTVYLRIKSVTEDNTVIECWNENTLEAILSVQQNIHSMEEILSELDESDENYERCAEDKAQLERSLKKLMNTTETYTRLKRIPKELKVKLKNADGDYLMPYNADVYNKSEIDEKLSETSAKADGVTITKNDSGEVQAVAVYEQNGTVKYDWIGTTAEYEAQNIATEHPTWVCYITDDYQNFEYATKDEVEADLAAVKSDIESNPAITAPYLKTSYVNDTSGYNIWSNGYCEQWGIATTTTTTSVTVTFLKTFKNTNYVILNTGSWSAGANQCTGWRTKTTTNITITNSYGNGTLATCWKASGYLADGEY